MRTSGEPGASGSAYIKHLTNDHKVLRVDNRAQQRISEFTNVPRNGYRKALSCGTASKSASYQCNGWTVTSSAAIYNTPYNILGAQITNDGMSCIFL